MPVDDKVLERARRFDRRAIEAVLEASYPAVHRMSHGLAGRADVARGIIRFLITHAPRQLPQWRDAAAPDRWFYHHTVLTARRASQHQPAPQEDLLVTQAGPSDAGYAAFIRALRSLPGQQREAFILHHGEHLNERFLSVAMDCSVKAAQVHLEAAEKALKAIGGEAFAPMTDRMAKAYHQLTPTEEFIRPEVRALVRRSLWPRRLRRIVRFILVGIILAAAACAAWRFRRVWLGQ